MLRYFNRILTEYFNKLDLNNLYFITNLSHLYLEGDYLNQYWTYLSFVFGKCSEKANTETLLDKNRKCSSQEDINSSLKSGYFGFFITDSRINALNYGNPRQLFGHNEFTTISYDVWLKLKKIQIITDAGFILQTRKIEDFAGTDSFTNLWDNRKTNNFLSFIIFQKILFENSDICS